MKNIAETIKKIFSLKSIKNCFLRVFVDYDKLVLTMLSLVLLSFGAYVWYMNIYRSGWSSEQKNQYKKSQNKEVNFKENEFNAVINEIKRRSDVYSEQPESFRDIFKSYSGDEKEQNEQNNTTVPAANQSVGSNNGTL